MSLIKNIQHQLQTVYDLKIEASAEDFLINKEQLLQILPAHQSTVVPKELFLINPKPENETLEIALFLDHSLQENLANNNPLQKLDTQNISDFCTLIEGVSHFVYYLHKASLAHNITELELELQAEIDKFVLLTLCTQSAKASQTELLDLLFENYFLFEKLSPEQIERYQTANTLARKYCFVLAKSLRQSNPAELLQNIRQFYQLNQQEKIRHILQ